MRGHPDQANAAVAQPGRGLVEIREVVGDPLEHVGLLADLALEELTWLGRWRPVRAQRATSLSWRPASSVC